MGSMKWILAMLLSAGATSAMPDTVTPGAVTEWGHPFGENNSSIRGLAFDGERYFVADAFDHYIDHRPRDNTGRVYIYDHRGNFIKRIPEEPPVRGTFFPHGVATDGVRLWATDYFDRNVYEYDIASGALLRRFKAQLPVGIGGGTTRIDYQASTRTLWVSVYGDSNIYQISMSGKQLSRFATAGVGPNLNPSLDGRGDLWVSSIGLDHSGVPIQRYSRDGTRLQSYGEPGWTSMATDITDRSRGYVTDLKPVFNADRHRWEAHLQSFKVSTVGGRTQSFEPMSVQCSNVSTQQVATAHMGTPTSWNCDDGGLAVSTGDSVKVELTGTAP